VEGSFSFPPFLVDLFFWVFSPKDFHSIIRLSLNSRIATSSVMAACESPFLCFFCFFLFQFFFSQSRPQFYFCLPIVEFRPSRHDTKSPPFSLSLLGRNSLWLVLFFFVSPPDCRLLQLFHKRVPSPLFQSTPLFFRFCPCSFVFVIAVNCFSLF